MVGIRMIDRFAKWLSEFEYKWPIVGGFVSVGVLMLGLGLIVCLLLFPIIFVGVVLPRVLGFGG
jgi:uncharacterized membrane protein